MIVVELRGGPLAPKALTASDLRDIGDDVILRVRRRTESGTDVSGAAFVPLSAGYAKRKAEAGLPPVANLTASGEMLNGMAIASADDKSVEIKFATSGGSGVGRTFIQRSRSVGAADKAFYHNETGAGTSRVRREFFGLSDADISAVEAAVRQLIGWE